jgi:glucosyl-3-phosphoglycerate synthase
MSDFHQSGMITTLHRLAPAGLERLETELKYFSKERPIALVLPCLYTEIQGEGLPRIRDVLREISYVGRVVISVSGTAEIQHFQAVQKYFQDMPEVTCVWGSGPTVGELLERLRGRGLEVGPEGKGRAVWIGTGYAIAEGESDAVATTGAPPTACTGAARACS